MFNFFLPVYITILLITIYEHFRYNLIRKIYERKNIGVLGLFVYHHLKNGIKIGFRTSVFDRPFEVAHGIFDDNVEYYRITFYAHVMHKNSSKYEWEWITLLIVMNQGKFYYCKEFPFDNEDEISPLESLFWRLFYVMGFSS